MRLMQDLVGETLSDRYRLVARVAGGGMGEVYRGFDLLLDRPVAVKVLQPSLANDPGLVERFKAEARAAARFAHSNVVGVYDWGSDGRTYYMVMEYVSGSDLRDLLVTRGALEPAQAAEIVAAMCDGLGAAHSAGLVHRDIKPENVLMARDGHVKVADFGIAVLADAERTAPSGGIPGTLRYLSPEQARGYEATAASDIWAAGMVLCELLTGSPPLQGAGAELLRRRASEPPLPPSALAPRTPPDLDAVVMRACAVDPDDRYDEASDMAHALRRAAARSLPSAPPVGSLLIDLTGEVHLPDIDATHFDAARRSGRRGLSVLKKGARALLIASVLSAVVVAGARAAPYLFGPGRVDVPGVVGLTRVRAQRQAAAAGLTLVVSGSRRVLAYARGDIVAQTPSGGTIEEGSDLVVVSSAGPPLEKVPALVGMSSGEALNALRAGGLQAGEIAERNSPHDEGTIIGQSPAGGKLEWGSEVGLVVSTGPKPLEVPEVSGKATPDALKLLKKAGFATITSEAYSDDVAGGAVVGTSPAAGTRATSGTEIEVIVSVGPRFEELTLPDVRGLQVDQARAQLERMGFDVGIVDSCDGGSTVVETDPIAGEAVLENESIALFLC